MTREMNKPDVIYCKIGRCYCTCSDGMCDECQFNKRQRVLNPDIEEFVKVLNERLK